MKEKTEKNDTKLIEEDIRHYKLYKIQVIDHKIQEFLNVYEDIRETFISKFIKNTISYIFYFVFKIISILFFLVGIIFFFPNKLIEFLQQNGETFSKQEIIDFTESAIIFVFLFIGLSILTHLLAKFINLNVKKKNIIYKLSNLVEDTILYMNEKSKEDRIRYEEYVENINKETPHNTK